MKKLIGSAVFVLLLCALLYIGNPGAFGELGRTVMARQIGQLGIICLGAGVLIIAGGIDLSMGSFMALCGAVLAVGISNGWHPAVGIAVVCAMGVAAGLIHGLLVTRFKLQAFIVTLCGLFIYRGLARWWTGDTNAGLGAASPGFAEAFYSGKFFGLPVTTVYFIIAAVLAAVLMHRSIYGRYLFAIGSNELAAKYSGIGVDRYKILSYVLCSLSAACYSVLTLAETKGVAPSTSGSSMELYAIAGAVLGGCSLRGGDGNIAGIILGTMILVLLKSVTQLIGIPEQLESTAIGSALLVGAILDETVRRRSAVRKA